jgi:hypothetical protein
VSVAIAWRAPLRDGRKVSTALWRRGCRPWISGLRPTTSSGGTGARRDMRRPTISLREWYHLEGSDGVRRRDR